MGLNIIAKEHQFLLVSVCAMEEPKERKEEEGENWSSAVEDLVDRGDIDGAISLLESLISKLKTLEKTSNLPLASALFDLADLYSSRGLSLKADELRNRALVIKLGSQRHYSRPLGLGLGFLHHHHHLLLLLLLLD